MSNHRATIEAWHGYKIAADAAEVVITGYGFGDATGVVRLNIQGTGKVDATVISWTDTSIIAAAPADGTVMRVHVYALDSRAKPKQADQSPASETRSTGDATPTWTVSTTDDTLDHLLVDGTGLEAVQDVFLFDNGAPEKVYSASFLQNGTALEIDWPASFTSPIRKIRLSDGSAGNVEEIDGGAAGFTPQANGIIDNVNVQVVDGSVLLNIIGNAFDDDQGTVKLRKVGGPLLSAPILTNGWSDSLVQVGADPASDYDLIELTRVDGEVATVGPNVPALISTPSLQIAVSNIYQYAFGGPVSIRMEGTSLNEMTEILLNFEYPGGGGFNRKVWNEDAFAPGDPINPAQRNANIGVITKPVFDPATVEFTFDAPSSPTYIGNELKRVYIYNSARQQIGFVDPSPALIVA